MRIAREAREVSGRDVFIAGAIGPLGELEMFDAAEHGPLYAEQAPVLEGRGVDLFMLETFFDLDELVAAVGPSGAVSSLPIVALLTFDEDAETSGGIGAAEAGARLAQLDVAAIGNNHGAGPHAALTALAAMRRIATAARDAPQHRPRQHRRRPGRLPALDPRVLRRVRRAGGRPRGAHHRRLLRHDAGADRGDPGRARRASAARASLFEAGERELPAAATCRARARRSSPARCARASGS